MRRPADLRVRHRVDTIDVTVGSFDDPSRFRPTTRFGVESRHDAWSDTRGLPELRSDTYEPLVQRWKDAGARPDE